MNLRSRFLWVIAALLPLPSVGAQQAADWLLSAAPALEIGASGSTIEFGQIAGIVRLSGGRFVVGDGSTGHVFFFDSAGKLLRSSGGRGAGPGEYQRLHRMGAYRGDSVWVSDQFSRLVTILDDSGRFGRRFRVQVPPADASAIYHTDVPHVIGALASGEFIIRTPPSLPLDAPLGSQWYTTRLIRASTEGAAVASLGPYRALPVEVRSRGVNGERRVAQFTQELSVAVLDSGVVVGGDPDYAVRFVATDGTERVWSDAMRGPRVTAAHRRAHEERLSAQAAREAARRTPLSFAEHLPPYAGFVVGPGNRILLDGYSLRGEALKEALVLHAGRGLIARIRIPARFTPLLLESERVVGIWRDPDGAESVRVYHLDAR